MSSLEFKDPAFYIDGVPINEVMRQETLKLVAEAYLIPVSYLDDSRTITLKFNERDIKKFYTRHNAMLKGWRRRCRRTKALISKLAHKK